MKRMDLAGVPLQGLNLIEASAGTGKTYTLTGLYLRLLIEQSLLPEQILVVTYTNAATSELKERIRQRLLATRQAFSDGVGDDPLIEHLLLSQPDRERAIKQLNLAIAAFDQAAIYTIHGFCQRVLIEHAFETSQPFEMELAPDQASRLLQIADDFWRIYLADLPERLTAWVQAEIGTPEKLLAGVRQGLGKPYLEVRGAEMPDDLEEADRQAAELIGEIRQVWQMEGDEIRDFLTDSDRFKQNSYHSAKVSGWCTEMAAWLVEEPLRLEGFTNLKKFTQRSIKAGLRKGEVSVESELFDKCQLLEDLNESRIKKYQAAVRSLRLVFYRYLLEELPKRQLEAREWSYDDLLLQLEQALSGQYGSRLVALLQQRFPVALVDEFQDTDPVQYGILSRIYGRSEQTVFLVGDPKQAIYSFRGADIFTYLTARKKAREHYSLEVNWRSSPKLIRAFNTLFSANPRAFYFPQIPALPVQAAPGKAKGLQEKGDKAGPLRIWQLPADPGIKLPMLRQTVADATAEEIARLLQLGRAGRLTLDGEPLGGGDIAVLVRKHRQAEQIAAALMTRDIHSVRTAQDNVFLTREAGQLERLLLALVEPRRDPLMRAALATELLGWNGREIDELNRDDALLSSQFETFLAYHQQWRDAGFIRMFRQLLSDQDVERRLLAYRDGERRLTNLYQLAELLHRHDAEAQPGMEGLLKWFSWQHQDEAVAEEERQLRLESDSHLVKIVTQHASKGLQYPVVFCPFLWDETLGLRNAQSAYLFHDPQADYQAVFELGSAGFVENQRYHKQEELAENLRLLYVALTRAQYRCYLPWGKVKHSENSALAWLLHPPGPDAEDPLASWQAGYKKLTAADIQQRIEFLVDEADGAISLLPLTEGSGVGQLSLELPPDLEPARIFAGVLHRGRRISSFSSLISGQAADLPDHDAFSPRLDDSAQQDDQALTIHRFPKGAQPGTCLHAIFEHLDFTATDRERLETLVEETLTAYGIEAHWTPVVADMIVAVLATPLNSEGLKLGEISNRQRITEMEFHYPVCQLDAGRLETLVRQHGFAASARLMAGFDNLGFTPIQGFMKGFIDLVFEAGGRYWLLDYKSNWLGNDLSSYAQPWLEQAMVEHHYPLQYLFYVLALHRYLQQRLADYAYDRHFGGVFYLFLRGMTPQAGCEYGVFQERPPAAFIQALDRLMAEGPT